MYLDLYHDEALRAVAVLDNERVTGLIITFSNVLARKIHYKPNSGMFVFKGRWFKGDVEVDQDRTLFMTVDRFGYIVIEGQDAHFKEVDSYHKL